MILVSASFAGVLRDSQGQYGHNEAIIIGGGAEHGGYGGGHGDFGGGSGKLQL